MTAVIGFVGLQVLLLCSGIAALRAFGLYPMASGRRALIAALGPALLLGAAVVLPLLIVLLVVGIPVTVPTAAVVGLGSAGLAEALARRRRGLAAPRGGREECMSGPSQAVRWLTRAGLAAAGAYVAFGAFALARLPTVGDDARIWSLRPRSVDKVRMGLLSVRGLSV